MYWNLTTFERVYKSIDLGIFYDLYNVWSYSLLKCYEDNISQNGWVIWNFV